MDNIPEYLATRNDGAVIYRTTGKRKLAARGECAYCDRLRESQGPGGFFPDHDAMRGCRSGGSQHCTCDRCF